MRYILIFFMMIYSTGCQMASRAISYTHTNPVVVDFATKQAIVRFINAGDSIDEKSKRALKVEYAIKDVEYFLEGNPTSSAGTLLAVVKSSVNLEKLSVPDRILVNDLMLLVESNLKANESAGYLEHGAVIRVRVLLRTLLKTAAMFK